MRLDRVYIDGFKNLREVEVDFDESRLATGLARTARANRI